MPRLAKRIVELQVDTIVVADGLRVGFKACKTLKPDPNTCDIVIYNLNPVQRAALTKVKTPVVSLTAGYREESTQIFLGQALHVQHERKGADIVTTIGTSDGGDKAQKARVNVSFGAKTKLETALRALVKALGVKEGNVSKIAQTLRASQKADIYLNGCTFSGSAYREMTALCRSAGLEWSIQDGAVQILDLNKALAQFAIVLDPDLLVGTPSISNKGLVSGTTLIQKDFLPGRQVQIKSELVSGAFRLEKCEYVGDTHSDDWYVNFEAKGTI